MIDAALRLRACDLKLRHNIFNKISKRKRKEEKSMRNVQLRKRIEGQRKRAGWLKWKRQCKPNRANNYQRCNTKHKRQRYNHTIHNELRQSHYSIQSRRTFVPSGVCNGSSETRKYCYWNQGKGLCGSRGWEAGACQVSLCVCCVGIDLLDIVVLYC